jgi:hypothetical protein
LKSHPPFVLYRPILGIQWIVVVPLD